LTALIELIPDTIMPPNNPDGELLDILDLSGAPLGFVQPRSIAHLTGLWHRTVHVWIVNNQNRVLLQKRARTKESFPGLWDISAAGHITAGDASASAARRELEEELGIEAGEGELKFLFTVKNSFEDPSKPFIDNEISDVYLAKRTFDPGTLVIDKTEIDEVRLFGIEELKEAMAMSPGEFVPHGEEYRRLFERLRG
jgi:isopentenyl-diphosphate delta-isomerase